MSRIRLPLLAWLFAILMPSADAQFVRPPVRVGFGGVGLTINRPFVVPYGGVRVSVGGFVPFAPYPFGVVERRVTVQVVGQPVVVAPPVYVEPAPQFDVSGVDLDMVRLPTPEELAAGKPLRAEPLPRRLKKKHPPQPKVDPIPKQPAPVKKPQPKKVVPDPKPAPEKPKPLTQEQILELGKESFRQKDYGLAVSRFRHATRVEALGHRGHFLLAQSWFALGNYKNAVRAIEAGMDRRPDWPTRKFSPRLEMYEGAEAEYDEQLKRLEKAVAQHPKRSDLLFLLAYQYWFDGRKDEATGLFRRARALTNNVLYIDRFLREAPPGKVAAK